MGGSSSTPDIESPASIPQALASATASAVESASTIFPLPPTSTASWPRAWTSKTGARAAQTRRCSSAFEVAALFDDCSVQLEVSRKSIGLRDDMTEASSHPLTRGPTGATLMGV